MARTGRKMTGNPPRWSGKPAKPSRVVAVTAQSGTRSWTSGNIGARLVPGDGSDSPEVRIALAWTAKAPWQVIAVIGDAEWILCRGLLIDGLTYRAGLGDVVLLPVSPREVELTVTGLDKDDDEMRVVLRLPTARLRGFLERTERIVPRGTYPTPADVDAAILALLTTGTAEWDSHGRRRGRS